MSLVALTLTVFAVGCGGGRSVDAFCGTLRNGNADIGDTLRASMESGSTMDALGGLLENIGRYSAMMRDLAEVAPNEIRTDIEVVAEQWADQADRIEQVASDPLGALLGGLTQGVMNAESHHRVDAFAHANCGESILGPS